MKWMRDGLAGALAVVGVLAVIGPAGCELDDLADADGYYGDTNQQNCNADNYCNPQCQYDPDCGGTQCTCASDSCCNQQCQSDPDCNQPTCTCTNDGCCASGCADDPDCGGTCACDTNRFCEAAAQCSSATCGCDDDCGGGEDACGQDGHCDTWCPTSVDPDCIGDPDDGKYCENPSECSADGWCDTSCGYDPDCGGTCDCDGTNGICDAGARCSEYGCDCDPDCGTACDLDSHCDTWCPTSVDPDCIGDPDDGKYCD